MAVAAPRAKRPPPDALRPLRLAALIALAPTALLVAQLLLPNADGVDPHGYHWGRDFVNFWSAARLARAGDLATLYDLDAYHAYLRATLAPSQPFMNFSYPPHALLPLLPLGFLPYGAAVALWTGAGLAAVLAAAGARPRSGLALVLVLAPATVLNLVFAQAGLFLAALFVGGFRLLPARPVVAGVLLGLLSVKPQLALLVPPALVLLGAWRALLAAGATAVALVALSLLLFGPQPWLDYFGHTLPYQARVAAEPTGLAGAMLVTPFALAHDLGRHLGLPVGTALAAHALVAAAVLLAAASVLRRLAEPALRTAVLALAAVVVTPYALAYDLAVPALAVAVWLAAHPRPLGRGTRLALVAFWLAPPTGLLVTILLGVPATPVAVLATLAPLVALALRAPSERRREQRREAEEHERDAGDLAPARALAEAV